MSQKNYVQWCMDSCRWDTYHLASTPHMDSLGNPRMVYARGGMTTVSLFGVFMNLSWYESNGEVPVPELKRWTWIPSELQKQGYHTVFISSNPMMKLYMDKFTGWSEYIDLKGCTYYADEIVDHVQRIYNTVTKPKYIFLLLMETHQPYPYRRGLTEEYYNENYRPITRQIKALENIDKDFGRMKKYLTGTNTDILIFSDHGDLDLKIEGAQGHGPALFHRKLFEVPLVRGTV